LNCVSLDRCLFLSVNQRYCDSTSRSEGVPDKIQMVNDVIMASGLAFAL